MMMNLREGRFDNKLSSGSSNDPFEGFGGDGGTAALARMSRRKRTSQLRLEKDLEELSYRRCERDFARSEINVFKGTDEVLPNIRVLVYPLKGPFQGGQFEFDLKIPEDYPYAAPVVHCLTRAFHPNICFYTGKVQLSLLSQGGWRPVFAINNVVLGLQLMFLEPQKQFATNKQCWDLYCKDKAKYEHFIRQSLHGGNHEGYELVNHFQRIPSAGSKRPKPFEAASAQRDSHGGSGGGSDLSCPPQKRRRLVSEITNKLLKTHVGQYDPRRHDDARRRQEQHQQQNRTSSVKKRRIDWIEPCAKVSRRRSDDKSSSSGGADDEREYGRSDEDTMITTTSSTTSSSNLLGGGLLGGPAFGF